MAESFARRVRNRLMRDALSRYLHPHDPGDLVRLGSDYGGWWVPQAAVGPGTVAYCAGAGEDITFDLELLAAGCQVTVFDPTPRAIAHVELHGPTEDPRFRFLPVGWWGSDTELKFYAPQDPAHVSHSAVNLQGTADYFTARVRPVHALMAELGDTRVDVIKMDIEGAEYAVIDSLLESGPVPAVLCVEFDQPTPARTLVAAVRRLQGAGYRLVRIEHWNYTFVRS